jgi:hypothetical protein
MKRKRINEVGLDALEIQNDACSYKRDALPKPSVCEQYEENQTHNIWCYPMSMSFRSPAYDQAPDWK